MRKREGERAHQGVGEAEEGAVGVGAGLGRGGDQRPREGLDAAALEERRLVARRGGAQAQGRGRRGAALGAAVPHHLLRGEPGQARAGASARRRGSGDRRQKRAGAEAAPRRTARWDAASALVDTSTLTSAMSSRREHTTAGEGGARGRGARQRRRGGAGKESAGHSGDERPAPAPAAASLARRLPSPVTFTRLVRAPDRASSSFTTWWCAGQGGAG